MINRIKIKSYAKVNLTLDVLGKEKEYHLLDSLVASIDLFDLVDVKKRKDKLNGITMYGMDSESIPPEQNNALKAADAFCQRFGTNGVDIKVFKNIPIGAGLGGSSADIVGVILGMAKLYEITDAQALKALADSLGSDTGYMLTGGFARMQGRGEKITPIDVDMQLNLLLFCPTSSVSAGACYREYDNAPSNTCPATENAIAALMDKDVYTLGRYLSNGLFQPATRCNSEVKTAYEQAAAFSPEGVTMTGSGSCVMAMFDCLELCAWARSRYKGSFKTYTVKTVTPDYGLFRENKE